MEGFLSSLKILIILSSICDDVHKSTSSIVSLEKRDNMLYVVSVRIFEEKQTFTVLFGNNNGPKYMWKY